MLNLEVQYYDNIHFDQWKQIKVTASYPKTLCIKLIILTREYVKPILLLTFFCKRHSNNKRPLNDGNLNTQNYADLSYLFGSTRINEQYTWLMNVKHLNFLFYFHVFSFILFLWLMRFKKKNSLSIRNSQQTIMSVKIASLH